MVASTLQTLSRVANDIPNLPVYMGFIAPGLCMWIIIWAKEKKVHQRRHWTTKDSIGKSEDSPADYDNKNR